MLVDKVEWHAHNDHMDNDEIINRALCFYHEALINNQHDGSHGDEIDALEALNYERHFINE